MKILRYLEYKTKICVLLIANRTRTQCSFRTRALNTVYFEKMRCRDELLQKLKLPSVAKKKIEPSAKPITFLSQIYFGGTRRGSNKVLIHGAGKPCDYDIVIGKALREEKALNTISKKQVSEVTHQAIIEISPRLHSVLQPRNPGVKFLEIVVALELRELRFHYGDVW